MSPSSAPPPPLPLVGPAIALLEFESMIKGMRAADVVVKKAPVQLAWSTSVTPGKHLLLFSGGVAEVEASFKEGVEWSGTSLLDRLFLPFASEGLLRGLSGQFARRSGKSIGLIETQTVAASLLVADVALKSAVVTLAGLRLAQGIGGKGLVMLSGELHDVEAALLAAASHVAAPLLLGTELISNPHPELEGIII